MENRYHLQDGLIAIRPFQADDAPVVYEAIQESIAQVSPWLPDLSEVSLEEVSAYIASQPEARAYGRAYNCAITDVRDTTILGGCGLTQINRRHRFANQYYWVRSSCTGRGVATKAVRLLAQFGFEVVHLHRIEIVVAVSNYASLRVAEKAGAVHEGVLRNRITVHDRIYDAVIFSFTPRDFGI